MKRPNNKYLGQIIDQIINEALNEPDDVVIEIGEIISPTFVNINEVEIDTNVWGNIQKLSGIKDDLKRAMKTPHKDVMGGDTYMKGSEFIKKTKEILKKHKYPLTNL